MQIQNKLNLKDPLDRRRRNAPRQPSEHPSRLNQTKLRLLEFVHLFGGFSTTQLVHEYARLEGLFKLKASTYTSKLLLEMFHDNGVLERPKEQRFMDRPDGFQTVHKVSEKGVKVLKDTGLYNEYAPKMHGWYKHQMMTACMYQMFYISARQAGIGFAAQHELKPKEKFIELPPKLKIYPDAVFVLNTGMPFLIFFELDRGTERGDDSSARKTWGKSIEYYNEILNRKLYTKNFELPEGHKAMLVTITTSNTMQKKILDCIKTQSPNGSARMLVQTTRAFGPLPEDINPPNYFDILNGYWERFGYPVWKFK